MMQGKQDPTKAAFEEEREERVCLKGGSWSLWSSIIWRYAAVCWEEGAVGTGLLVYGIKVLGTWVFTLSSVPTSLICEQCYLER